MHNLMDQWGTNVRACWGYVVCACALRDAVRRCLFWSFGVLLLCAGRMHTGAKIIFVAQHACALVLDCALQMQVHVCIGAVCGVTVEAKAGRYSVFALLVLDTKCFIVFRRL